MKKLSAILLSIVTLLALTIFASCTLPEHVPSSKPSDTATGSSGSDTPDPEVLTAEKALENITALLNEDYSQITLTVTVSANGLTDIDTYKMTYGNGIDVEYSVKRANPFKIENGVVIPPETPYNELTGTVKVSNGTVTKISGDDVNVDFLSISKLNLNLNAQNFNNLTVSETSLKGEVTSPKTVFNNQTLTAENCKIDVSYGATLKFIKFKYTDNTDSNVQVEYSFTK